MVKPVAETVAPQLHGSLSQTVNTEQAAKSKYPGLYYGEGKFLPLVHLTLSKAVQFSVFAWKFYYLKK